MNNDVKQFYKEENDIFGLPQTYKGVKFYPLKIIDFEYMRLFHELFSYPKSSVDFQDPTILKMSYLKFLLVVLQNSIGDPVYVENGFIKFNKLIKFLEFVTKQNVYLKAEETSGINLIILYIGDVSFSENEFSNIREIILEQNGSCVEYVEAYNEKLEKDLKFVHRDLSELTMKDQIFSLCAMYGKTVEEISTSTLYQMKYLLESMSTFLEFKMQTIPLTEVTEKYSVKSYLKHLERKGRYDEVIQDKDEFVKNSPYFKSNIE